MEIWNQGNLASKYMHIFAKLLKLRQACDHRLIVESKPVTVNMDRFEDDLKSWLNERDEAAKIEDKVCVSSFYS